MRGENVRMAIFTFLFDEMWGLLQMDRISSIDSIVEAISP
jgi:hypothetical protein